jgi:hypothetical protein
MNPIYLNAENRAYVGDILNGCIVMTANDADPPSGTINFYVNDENFATVGEGVVATFIRIDGQWREIAEHGL